MAGSFNVMPDQPTEQAHVLREHCAHPLVDRLKTHRALGGAALELADDVERRIVDDDHKAAVGIPRPTASTDRGRRSKGRMFGADLYCNRCDAC